MFRQGPRHLFPFDMIIHLHLELVEADSQFDKIQWHWFDDRSCIENVGYFQHNLKIIMNNDFNQNNKPYSSILIQIKPGWINCYRVAKLNFLTWMSTGIKKEQTKSLIVVLLTELTVIWLSKRKIKIRFHNCSLIKTIIQGILVIWIAQIVFKIILRYPKRQFWPLNNDFK